MRGQVSGMNKRLAFAVVTLASCGTSLYVEPTPDQPHGLIKLQIAYHAAGGTNLDEAIEIDALAITLPAPTVDSTRAYLRAVRVAPGNHSVSFRSTFVHYVTRLVTQHYTEYERYPCGTTRSGYGRSSYTSTQYCSRAVQRTRTVPQTSTVVDGACARSGPLGIGAGDELILRYDYFGHEQCSVRCYRQVPGPGGTFAMQPCGGTRTGR